MGMIWDANSNVHIEVRCVICALHAAQGGTRSKCFFLSHYYAGHLRIPALFFAVCVQHSARAFASGVKGMRSDSSIYRTICMWRLKTEPCRRMEACRAY